MRNALLGVYSYAEFGLCIATFYPLLGIAHLRHKNDPTQRVPGQWMRRLGRTAARLTPLWKFTVEGNVPADIRERPYVVIANHESVADPFLLSFLPWDMRWVGKEELFKIPVIGTMLRWSGDIPIRRGKGESVREMFHACHETLKAGQSVMLFPEGTRSADGVLQKFKDGAFQLAIEAQVPVLPVAVSGTRECRPKGSKWFGKADAFARVLTPIETKGMTMEDLPRLREAAREQIAATLGLEHA